MSDNKTAAIKFLSDRKQNDFCNLIDELLNVGHPSTRINIKNIFKSYGNINCKHVKLIFKFPYKYFIYK